MLVTVENTRRPHANPSLEPPTRVQNLFDRFVEPAKWNAQLILTNLECHNSVIGHILPFVAIEERYGLIFCHLSGFVHFRILSVSSAHSFSSSRSDCSTVSLPRHLCSP